jgi:predicted metalloendopeptidase
MPDPSPTAFPIAGYADRLKSAANAVAEAKERWKKALQQRNEIIAEAVDNGFPQSAAARHAKVSQPHVVRVMAGTYDDVADLVA